MIGVLIEALVETELILLATNEKELAGFIDFFFKPFLNRERISNSVKNRLICWPTYIVGEPMETID